jgi:hypothetical protein
LTVTDSTISGNTAAIFGGGIDFYSGGQLTLTRTTISGNVSTYTGVGFGGGGVYFWGTASGTGVTISDSTISGNSAGGPGGGLFFTAFSGSARIQNSTITLNSSADANYGGGGGIAFMNVAGLTLSSSILAGNTNAKNADLNDKGTSLPANNSLIGALPGGVTLSGNGNLAGTAASPVDPRLGPLENNGGLTMTHAPLAGSPAIDTGAANGLSVDQRGFPRVSDGAPDIGALEVLPGAVVSITYPLGPPLNQVNPTNSPTLTFVVTLNQPIFGVNPGDFALASPGGAVTGMIGAPTTTDNITWTVPVTGVTGTGTIQLDMVGFGGTSIALFPGLPYTGGDVVTEDQTPPTITSITLAGSTPTNATSVNFDVNFSEPVLGVTASNFAVSAAGPSGYQITNVVGSGAAWTVTVNTGSGDGLLGLNAVNVAAATDLVGNPLAGLPVTSPTYTIDKTPPTVLSITQLGTTPTNAGSVSWQVTFSESVVNVGPANFSTSSGGTLSGTSITGVTGGTAGIYTVTANTGSGDGLLGLIFLPAGIQDPAGNAVAGSPPTPPGYLIDKTPPTVSAITALGPNPTNGAYTVDYRVVFSEAVTGVATGDFGLTLGGFSATGTIAGITGSGSTYDVMVNNVDGAGTLQLNLVSGGTIADLAANALTGFPFTGETTTVASPGRVKSITAGGPNPTNGSSETWTVQFNQQVTGVLMADFSLATTGTVAGTITGFSGSQDTYTVTATGVTGDGNVSLSLSNVSGISPAFTASPPFTGGTVTVDHTPPTVSSITRAGSSPTKLGSVSWQVVFGEPVTGVSLSDFALAAGGTLTGTSLTGVTGSGTTYTVTAATGSGDGPLGLNVVASGSPILDAATNALVTPFTGQVYTIDRTPPVVSNITLVGGPPTNSSSVSWTVMFDEAVTGLSAANLVLVPTGTLLGTSLTGVSGSGTTWTVTASTGTGEGDLGMAFSSPVNVADIAGNAFVGPLPTGPSFIIDRTAPFPVSITALGKSITDAASVSWSVKYSEPVINVTAANFAVIATGVSGAAITNVTGSGTTYTVTVSTGSGDGSLGLNTGTPSPITDLAGNGLTAATVVGPVYVIDHTAPSVVSITQNSSTNWSGTTASWTVVFSEPIIGLSASNFSLAQNGGLTGSTITSVTGAASQYTVTATVGTGNGTLGLTAANSTGATDLAGNAVMGLPVPGPAYVIDRTLPTATITTLDPVVSNASTVHYQVVLSKPMTGVSTANFALVRGGSIGGGSVTGISGSGTTYVVTVDTGGGTGTIGLNLAAPAGAIDAFGNPPATPEVGPIYTIDRTLPLATISLVGPSLTNADQLQFQVTFSKPVVGVKAGNFKIIADGVIGAGVSDVSQSGGVYTVTVDTGTGTGTVGLNLLSAGITDGVGNVVEPAVGPVYSVDRTAPLPNVTTSAGNTLVYPLLPVTVTFPVAVTGFSLAGVTVTNGTARKFAAVSGTTYTFEVVPVDAGQVTVAVIAGAATDAAGNASLASAPLTRTLPPLYPTVTLTSSAPPTTNRPIDVTATFSQAVTGFSAAGLVTTNATVTTFTAVSPTVYTFRLIPTADGTVAVDVPANAGVNVIGVGNRSAELTRTFDDRAPTAVIAPAARPATAGATAPVQFTVTFSEPVISFNPGDVAVSGTATGTPAVTLSGTGAAYLVTVSGMTGPGTVTISVPPGVTQDAAGNTNLATTPATVTLPAVSTATAGIDRFSVGAAAGGSPLVNVYDGGTGAKLASVSAFDQTVTGGVRVATADFNGDGVQDLVIGTGPGVPSQVWILDGKDQHQLFSINPFEATFTGGVYVAAGDVSGDGVPDLVISPDQGGGPRVMVLDGAAAGKGNVVKIADFYGIADPAFRGGARAAVGDVNGDGVGDLVVAAGFLGGPRIAGYDGKSLASGNPTRIFADFFGLEPSARNGVYVAVGDVTGDGFADIVVGGGPSGGPRVVVYNGKSLLGNTLDVAADFFAGDPSTRGGVRVATRNLDGDDRADVLVGAGDGAGSFVAAYYGKDIRAGITPPTALSFDAFPGFSGGVFVG